MSKVSENTIDPISHYSNRVYSWLEPQWQRLLVSRAADHLPHAVLLTGGNGIGKTDFAHLFANSLLCEQIDSDGYACGECASCKVKKSNAHPDYKFVGLPEGKQQIPVNAIRELTDFMVLSRSYQGYRVVVISAADKMNLNASNSLLKSLEEPPPKTVIILVADQLSKLPVTIRSRCQVISMPTPDKAAALAWLEQQSLKNSAEMMLSLADNKPLLALSLDADEELLAQRNKFAKDVMAVLKHYRSVTEVAKEWEKADINMLLNWQIKWMHAVAKMQAIHTMQRATTESSPEKVNKFLAKIQSSINNSTSFWKLYTDLLHLKSMTDYPLNRLMFIESMLLLWSDVGRPQSS